MPTDSPRTRIVIGIERIPIGIAETTGEKETLLRIGRHRLGLKLIQNLQAVLHIAQEPVVFGQLVRFVGAQNSRLPKPRERIQRIWRAKDGEPSAELELEKLDEKLNVANPSNAYLHVE